MAESVFWLARADDSTDFESRVAAQYCHMMSVFAYAERPSWLDIFSRVVGPGETELDVLFQTSPEQAKRKYGVELEEGDAVLLAVSTVDSHRPDGTTVQCVVGVKELERFAPARQPGDDY